MKAEKAWTELGSLAQGSMLSYLTGIYMFAHYIEAAARWPILGTIRFHFLFGLLLCVLCLIKKMSDRNSTKLETTPVTRITYILIGLYGLYAVFSMDTAISFRIYPDRVVKFAFAAFFIFMASEKPEDIRIIMLFILLGWAKIAQEGVVGWITGGQVWENQGIARLHGSIPSMGNPNSLSGFAVSCLPFCVYLMDGVKHKAARFFLLALFASAIIIVINTGSRTGYVATIGGAAISFYYMKSSFFKKIFVAICIIALVVSFLPDQYKERFESIYTGKEKEGASAASRNEIIVDAIKVFEAHPFGVGIGAFPTVRGIMFNRFQDTHNLYLEVLTNVGIVGFLVFLVFIKRLLSQNYQNIKRLSARVKLRQEAEAPVDQNLAFMLALSKAMLGFLIVRLFLGLFGMDMYEIYWWFALGFSLAVNRMILLMEHDEEAVKDEKTGKKTNRRKARVRAS